MGNLVTAIEHADRRSEPRRPADRYHSVELCVNGLSLPYQFKLWNIASRSLCVMVREDSDILERIRVGDILNMKYYTGEASCPVEQRATEIRHITKDEEGRFKGHYLVGLAILSEDGGATPN
ncbi:MAG: hypothetical protein JRF59_13285 [Deltaproteobacteria bacterium]|nr:hypothetical protein [Deltaproteobacteria bacterium]MBW1949569.1 hypothetical protein [Deltaproteobacteria bacterium]MBW2009146.1 hypothetical protein [Deltaproteobacteria bacterium]MBW2102765.1 hypothetical protein [Deltaproteobacteria bacterium]MBW2348793.1 hypothetical protein [Deltaproteobacteria bacterium]